MLEFDFLFLWYKQTNKNLYENQRCFLPMAIFPGPKHTPRGLITTLNSSARTSEEAALWFNLHKNVTSAESVRHLEQAWLVNEMV